jgi:hypothetical protein
MIGEGSVTWNKIIRGACPGGINIVFFLWNKEIIA